MIRRILHCIPNMLNGGAQRQLVLLAREQVAAGLEAHVALLHAGPHTERLESVGARLHWIGSGINHDPRLFWRLIHLIRRVQPDLVQSWLTQMDVLVAAATRVTGTPWVLSERCSAQNYPPSAKHLARILLARRTDAVVSNSRGGDDYWRGRLPPDVPRHVVANGIPLAEIAEAEPASRESLGLLANEKMVLHVGRLEPQKNIETLVPALDAAAQLCPMVAYLCGDGTEEAQASQLVREHSTSGRIRLLGYRPDVWSLMKRADILVSLSRFEGHPNAVLEAAACGCPLVLSDIPAHREVADDKSACFVDENSIPTVASAIVRCLAEPDDTRLRSLRARSMVEGLSPQKMALQYSDLYQDVLARRALRRTA